MKKYNAVLKGPCGNLRGFEAKISIDPEAKPHFCKAISNPTHNAWAPTQFCCDPSLLNTITQGGGGGGGDVHGKKIITSQITATCFSNPHTNLGVRRSRRLGDYVCHKLGSAIS